MQLCLPKPYGYPRGVHISLTSPAGMSLDVEAAVDALLEVGCYPASVSRAVSAIKHSGRYDCQVQVAIADDLDLPKIMAEAMIAVEIEAGYSSKGYHSRELRTREKSLSCWPAGIRTEILEKLAG
jgi:hypothetical protein